MNVLRQLAARLSHWIDDAALALVSILSVLQPSRKFQIIEQADLAFAVRAVRRQIVGKDLGPPLRFADGQFVEGAGQRIRSRLAGGQIELVLARRRFIFRSLELPQQASGFLDAIVRSQIDRLTPWSPAQAVFGCGPPAELPGGRINVVVAATARASVMPFVSGLEALKLDSIVVSATPEEESANAPRTIVFSQHINRETSLRRLRRILIAGPAAAGVAAVFALAAYVFVGAGLEASQLEISKQMAERRVALLSGRPGAGQEAATKLAQQKRDTPATVIVLDELSAALPDDTYLTEMHVAGGKLEITGVTRQAASLIRIIEQTDQFTDATFFAPTTRAPQEVGEQFHIEAKIVPYFPSSP